MQWSQGTTYPPPNNNWIINSSLGCLLQYTCMHTPLLPEQSHISIDSTCFQVILIRNAGTRPTFPASCVEPISPQDPFKRQEPPRGNANTSADTVIPCNFQVCYCSVLTSGTIYTPFICNEKKKECRKRIFSWLHVKFLRCQGALLLEAMWLMVEQNQNIALLMMQCCISTVQVVYS